MCSMDSSSSLASLPSLVGGLGHGLIGPAVAAWPAVALVGVYQFLMMVIRRSQVSADDTAHGGRVADPLQEQAADAFIKDLAPDRVPRCVPSAHVGQLRAQRPRNYLAAEARGQEHGRAA